MNNENQINDPMGNHSQPQNPFSAPVEPQPAQPSPFGAQAGEQPQPAQPNSFGAQAGAQPQPAQPSPFGAQAGEQPQPAQPNPFGAQAGAQPQPAQPSPFGAQAGAQPQPAQPSPFGAQTGAQPQPAQPSPFAAPNTFANQKMGGAKMKKPMKLGWIISLVALVLSIIGIVIGGTMFGTGLSTIQKNISADSRAYARADINPETYVYKGLTKGKEYYLVLTQEAGPELVNIKVDGNQLVSFISQKQSTSSGSSTLKIFRFVASSSEAKVEISGVTKATDAGLSLVNGEKYGSIMAQMGIGLILAFIAGFATFISAVTFIVFLIIFLVKNSKYKNAQRNITMA